MSDALQSEVVTSYGGGVLEQPTSGRGVQDMQFDTRFQKRLQELTLFAFQSTWDRSLEVCESPIERLMLVSLVAALGVQSGEHGWAKGVFGGASCHITGCSPVGLGLVQQLEVGPYRLDFAITDQSADSPAGLLIDVECDGHEWHDRTKEQASRDRKRDRYLTSKGWRVVRFTGRDIWGQAARCGVDVALTIDELRGGN